MISIDIDILLETAQKMCRRVNIYDLKQTGKK